MTVGLVNIGMGNLGSLSSALEKLSIPYKSCKTARDFSEINKIILPGVGNFDTFMVNLKKRKIDKVILDLIKKDIPILGICLGFQILFEGSEEGNKSKGLSLLRGNFKNFKNRIKNLNVPHTGWNQCKIVNDNKLFKNIKNNSDFYFTHSYFLRDNLESIVMTKTDYSFQFVSSVSYENLYGVQFHPEKSQHNGLQLIKNFYEVC